MTDDTIRERTFVYAIGIDDGPVKVGITQNLLSRLRTLQNGSPGKLELIWVYTTWDKAAALRMEKNFHAVYAEYRLEGEWFKVSALLAFEGLEAGVMHLFDRSIECFMRDEALCARHIRKGAS
jgi:predicted GIY-YIG superfamily endonuclease